MRVWLLASAVAAAASVAPPCVGAAELQAFYARADPKKADAKNVDHILAHFCCHAGEAGCESGGVSAMLEKLRAKYPGSAVLLPPLLSKLVERFYLQP